MAESPISSETHDRAEAIDRIDRIARRWATMTPPIRPSGAEVARFEAALIEAAPSDDPHVLLLGATPELRSLVHKLGYRLTGCDIDELFWHAMSQLLTSSGPETFIHGNWLELPVEGAYDVVLGHGSLNMLSWQDMGSMIPKLVGHLGPGGKAVIGMQASNPALGLDTLEEAIAAYPGERVGRPFLVAMHFHVESVRSVMHPEMTNREFYQEVVSGFLEPEEMAQLLPITRDKRNFYPTMEAVQELFRQGFEILHQETLPESSAWGTHHLFLLQPLR